MAHEWYQQIKAGPYLMIILNSNKITPELAEGIIDRTSFYRINPEAEREGRAKGIKNIFETKRTHLIDERKFELTKKPEDEFQYGLEFWSLAGKPNFRLDNFIDNPKEKAYLAMHDTLRHLPTDNLEKMSQLLGDFRRIVDYVKPVFAWGGDFYYLLKFEGQDARKHFFPVTFYGKDMVDAFGKEKFLSAPVWKAEELGGGVILQVQENPFYKVDKVELEKVEKYLGLEKII